uniref:Uncharacterized protein n=1 Tax=Plectus sambesii TaxID=2011161 RepID=A0A914UJ62_9BILA
MEVSGWATTLIIVLLLLIALALWTVFCMFVSRTVSKIYCIRKEQRRTLRLRRSIHAAIQRAIPSISENVSTTLPLEFTADGDARTLDATALPALPTYEQIVGESADRRLNAETV